LLAIESAEKSELFPMKHEEFYEEVILKAKPLIFKGSNLLDEQVALNFAHFSKDYFDMEKTGFVQVESLRKQVKGN